VAVTPGATGRVHEVTERTPHVVAQPVEPGGLQTHQAATWFRDGLAVKPDQEPSFDTLDEWSIEAWTRLQGTDGERVLVWRGFLGRALTGARRYQEAEEVLLQLLVDRGRLLGPQAPGSLVVRGNLARAIALGVRPHEAMVLAQKLLDDRTRLMGADDPATLDTRDHIAHFHYLAGRTAKAVRLYEALLVDRKRVRGPTHSVVAMTEANLAAVRAKATGSVQDLDALRQQADETLLDVGPDHPDIATSYAIVAERLVDAHHVACGLLVAPGEVVDESVLHRHLGVAETLQFGDGHAQHRGDEFTREPVPTHGFAVGSLGVHGALRQHNSVTRRATCLPDTAAGAPRSGLDDSATTSMRASSVASLYAADLRPVSTSDGTFSAKRRPPSPAMPLTVARGSRLGGGQATSRNFRSARRMISLAEVWSAFARASMADRRSGSMRTGMTSAGPEPMAGRPRRRSLRCSMS
jgi:hypothetical protein